MKKKDRSQFEDIFQEKLYNLDADVDAGCWDAIESRLPKRKAVPFYLNFRYIAAVAAMIALLFSVSTLYNAPEQRLVSQTLQTEHKQAIIELTNEASSIKEQTKASVGQAFAASIRSNERKAATIAQTILKEATPKEKQKSVTPTPTPTQSLLASTPSPLLLKKTIGTKSHKPKKITIQSNKEKKTRRWSFGMGGGSLSASSGSISPLSMPVVNNLPMLKSGNLSNLKESEISYRTGDVEKTDIHHSRPISIGIGVGYSLNKRWSLQSGLQYSYLASEWNTNLVYRSEAKQQLHFIGIPLSINYTLAEWKRLRFYASAGVLGELNVSGRVRSKRYSEDGSMLSELTEKHRMKQIQWSTHTSVGASYPLIRFVSVYAEAGLSYYFDNGSSVETYYTDKAFTPNARLGFRFGF